MLVVNSTTAGQQPEKRGHLKSNNCIFLHLVSTRLQRKLHNNNLNIKQLECVWWQQMHSSPSCTKTNQRIPSTQRGKGITYTQSHQSPLPLQECTMVLSHICDTNFGLSFTIPTVCSKLLVTCMSLCSCPPSSYEYILTFATTKTNAAKDTLIWFSFLPHVLFKLVYSSGIVNIHLWECRKNSAITLWS